MMSCIAGHKGDDPGCDKVFWVWLLDFISTYELQPEQINDWQCQLFISFYEAGCAIWPETAEKIEVPAE